MPARHRWLSSATGRSPGAALALGGAAAASSDIASKWAHSKVSVVVTPGPAADGDAGTGGWLHIAVDDDGPGLTAEERAQPIARGRRLDETKPGSGLGHSIVADLAYCYNGSFELGRSPSGGLSARLTLPLAT